MSPLFKGYPYGEAKSLEIFPLNERPFGQHIDKAVENGVGITAEVVSLYSRALHEAEQQIKDLQTDYPFLPEDYGFVELEMTNSATFIQKYKAEGGNVGIDRLNDSQYRIRATYREFVDNDGNTVEEKSPIDLVISINNEKEAFSAFKTLGLTKYIKTKNETRDGDLVSTTELVLNNQEHKAEETVAVNEEPVNKPPTENVDAVKSEEVTGFPNREEDKQTKNHNPEEEIK